jgi:hypothetical protein
MNRNTKRYPQEEITSLKKRGKRLRGGYLLAKLKNWKSSGSKPEIDRPKTIKPKPLTTKRKTQPKQKVEAKGRAIPKSIEVKPVKAKKTIAKQPKQKVEAKGRAIPKSIEIKPVEKKVRKPRKERLNAGKLPEQQSVNKVVIEKIKQAEQKPVEKKVRKSRQKSVNKIVVEKIKQAEQKPVETETKRTIRASSFIDELHNETIFEKYGFALTKLVSQSIKDLLPKIPQKTLGLKQGIERLTDEIIFDNNLSADKQKAKELEILLSYYVIYTAGFDGSTRKKDSVSKQFLDKLNIKWKLDNLYAVPNVAESFGHFSENKKVSVNDKMLENIAKLMLGNNLTMPSLNGGYVDQENGVIVFTDTWKMLLLPMGYLNISKKLNDKTIYNFAKLKGHKDIINQPYVPYRDVIPNTVTQIMALNVDREIEKCKRIDYLSKYIDIIHIDDRTQRKTYPLSKVSINSAIHFNWKYYRECLETLKILGKNTFDLFVENDEDDKILPHRPLVLISDDIRILLMPIRVSNYNNQAFDNAQYNFGYPIGVIKYLNPIEMSMKGEYLDKGLSDSISDDAEQQALFDNFNPNTEQELQAIAKDIPAFGDDVNEEKFDVDGKYNLPEVVQKRDNMEVASVKDIKTMRFKALTLPSKYRQLLGKVPANFRMLLWGSPGHGKSSLALTIANDIGKFVKTLYVSAEESLQSATLSSRIKRFKANARNLMFNDSNNPDILDKIIMTQNPKFVVIDSVNVMIGKTEAIINLMLKYPEVGFIIIAQATKDRKKYAGLGSLAHAVDIVVNVRSGMAVAEKNRYAQLGSMPVKGIKI